MERESHWSQAHSLLQSRVEALIRENQELHSRFNVNKSLPQSAGSSAPHHAGSYSAVKVNSNLIFNNDPQIKYFDLNYIFIHIKAT